MLNLNKLERQIKLEEEMRGLGVLKYRRDVEKAKARGAETSTSYGMTLLSQAIEPTAKKIAEIVKDQGGRPVSKQGIAYPILKQLTPDVLAFLTIKAVLDTISISKPYTQACIALSRLIEDELMYRKFIREHRHLFRSMRKSFKERSAGEEYQRQVTRLIARRKGIEMADWNVNLRVNMGTVLIGALIEATGMVSIQQKPHRGKTESYLEAEAKTLEWINGKNAFCEVLSPTWMPCIVQPRQWTNLYDGGFYTDISRCPLIKTRDKKYLRKLEEAQMPEVFDAVNILQNTSWRVNPSIYSVIRQMVDSNVTLGLIPQGGDKPDLPERPHDIATNEAARKVWKAAAREAYNQHTKVTSKRLALMKQLWVAEKYKDEEEMYFIYTLDFRGRAYPIQLFLNPQGDDVARALLTFAKGKPLGNDGACWLAIHGANMFGFDKVSLQERIDWAMEHSEEIKACAVDPFSNRWWTEADKPFMFLAFCYEWVGYLTEGEEYVCSLPVSMDGSCNGLQNFSAMLLDDVGGAAVNLVPATEPQDVYGLVGKKMADHVETDTCEEAVWWRGKVTRSICKRPVMTLPYGVTKIGMIEQIAEELYKKRNDGELEDSYSDLAKYARYFGKVIYDVISTTLVAAPLAMDWLKAVADAHTGKSLPIEWTVPTGFRVVQAYYKSKEGRVRVKASNISVRPQVRIYVSELDSKHQKNGISPNFVHSMDAAHMMKTLILASANDITHFAMVHDSFGTHAADAPLLGNALRSAFVSMYKEHDVMQEAYEMWGSASSGEAKVEIPPPPAKGNLDLDLILKSEFFFA